MSMWSFLSIQADDVSLNDSNLAHTSVLFLATSKNSARYLPVSFDQIDHIGSLFKRYHVLLYTDDNNQDQTEDLLHEYVAKSPSSRMLLVEKNTHPHRTQRIAQARNRLLETAYAKGYLDDYTWVIQLDIDDSLTGKKLDPQMLNRSISLFQHADVVCANNSPDFYYDSWALRTDLYDSWLRQSFQFVVRCAKHVINFIVPNTYKRVNRGDLSHWFGPPYRDRDHIDGSAEPVSVRSCFGGFAIYRASSIADCMQMGRCRYQEMTDGFFKKPECEHISFHYSLGQNTGARFVIDPQLVTGGPDHGR